MSSIKLWCIQNDQVVPVEVSAVLSADSGSPVVVDRSGTTIPCTAVFSNSDEAYQSLGIIPGRTQLFCLLCDAILENQTPAGVMPQNGTAFASPGHPGSSFDPSDNAQIALALCNECLHKNAEKILYFPDDSDSQYTKWDTLNLGNFLSDQHNQHGEREEGESIVDSREQENSAAVAAEDNNASHNEVASENSNIPSYLTPVNNSRAEAVEPAAVTTEEGYEANQSATGIEDRSEGAPASAEFKNFGSSKVEDSGEAPASIEENQTNTHVGGESSNAGSFNSMFGGEPEDTNSTESGSSDQYIGEKDNENYSERENDGRRFFQQSLQENQN